MSPQCNHKGKKNYQTEKIACKDLRNHSISQILIKSATNIFEIPTNTVYLYILF